MNYYTSNVKLVGGNLEYNVPDTKKIASTKFKWFTENRAVEGSIQAECCFVCPDLLLENDNLQSITQQEYNDFATVSLISDKSQITADGTDFATVTATFPELGGIATFTIFKPNQDKQTVEKMIPESGIVTVGENVIISNIQGLIKISISSKKWSGALGSGEIYVESI